MKRDITPHSLQELFENQKKDNEPGAIDRMEPVKMPCELWMFVKEWCVPMLGAENYFPELFGKYGKTFTGICDGWWWLDERLKDASEKDLWEMLAIASTYWLLNYEKWFDKERTKLHEIQKSLMNGNEQDLMRGMMEEMRIKKCETHIDNTDCIWYGTSDNRCPVTCSQYRDGWNDAMDYIFKNGEGYKPYQRGKKK